MALLCQFHAICSARSGLLCFSLQCVSVCISLCGITVPCWSCTGTNDCAKSIMCTSKGWMFMWLHMQMEECEHTTKITMDSQRGHREIGCQGRKKCSLNSFCFCWGSPPAGHLYYCLIIVTAVKCRTGKSIHVEILKPKWRQHPALLEQSSVFYLGCKDSYIDKPLLKGLTIINLLYIF